MPSVFLCHASEDKPLVEPMQLALVSAGCEVFYDQESLPPGGDYHARIRDAIQRCDVFVFVASPASITSGKYTLTELKFARERWPSPTDRVLPVAVGGLKPSDLPAYLRAVTVLAVWGDPTAEVLAATEGMLRRLGLSTGPAEISASRDGRDGDTTREEPVDSRRPSRFASALLKRAIRTISAGRYALGAVGLAAAASLVGGLLLYNRKAAILVEIPALEAAAPVPSTQREARQEIDDRAISPVSEPGPRSGLAIVKREQLAPTSDENTALRSAIPRADAAEIRLLLQRYASILGMGVGDGRIALVFSNYPLGSDLTADFLVVTAPQWYQLDLIVIASAKDRPFNKDGSPTRALDSALFRASQLRARLTDNISTVGRDVGRAVRASEEAFLRVAGNVPAYFYLHPNQIASGLERLSFRWGVTVIMGARSMYGPGEDEGRKIFMQSNPGIRLITYDFLIDRGTGR